MKGEAVGRLVSVLIALLLGAGPGGAAPTLVGDPARAECRAALDMATEAFRSTSPVLTSPVPAPDPDQARLSLWRKGQDLSGGDGVAADPAIFERIEQNRPVTGRAILHWQRAAREGRRVVVAEAPFNWAGSWYYLFVVDATLAKEAFLDAFTEGRATSFNQPGAAGLVPALGGNRWSPPTVLQDAASGALWVLDQGEGYQILPDWQVTVIGAGGLVPLCRVTFVPAGFSALDGMPPSVRYFAALADEALGPKNPDEGTLRPKARIRGRVAQDWALIAERPWALTATPYNSRAEVEAGLEAWASDVTARARLHRRLLASLGPAERELAGYLSARFALGEAEARAFSAYAIDHMLRRYFKFHSDSDVARFGLAPSETPWPPDLR